MLFGEFFKLSGSEFVADLVGLAQTVAAELKLSVACDVSGANFLATFTDGVGRQLSDTDKASVQAVLGGAVACKVPLSAPMLGSDEDYNAYKLSVLDKMRTSAGKLVPVVAE